MEIVTKKINLKKNQEYKLCTCGASKSIPFCDESHKKLNEEKRTNYKSLKITPKNDIILDVSSNNWRE